MFGFGRFIKRQWSGLKKLYSLARELREIDFERLKGLVSKESSNFKYRHLSSTDFDEPFYSGLPKKIVLIASQPRTGSSLLVSGLASLGVTPRITTEIFNPHIMAPFQQRWGYLLSDADYLRLLFCYRTNPEGVFAFKSHYLHYHPRFKDLMPLELCSNIILLERRNKIDQAISYYIAEKTDMWASSEESDIKKRISPPYDYEALLNFLRWTCGYKIKGWHDLFLAKNIKPRYLVYEEFSQNYQSTIAELASWISGREFKAEDIAPPALKIQRDELNQAFKERFIQDLRAHGIDESQYQRLYWPERSGTAEMRDN